MEDVIEQGCQEDHNGLYDVGEYEPPAGELAVESVGELAGSEDAEAEAAETGSQMGRWDCEVGSLTGAVEREGGDGEQDGVAGLVGYDFGEYRQREILSVVRDAMLATNRDSQQWNFGKATASMIPVASARASNSNSR